MQRVLDNIESLIPVGESFELCVTGYSMLPLLGRAGDKIILRRTAVSEDIIGRIAMFRGPRNNIIIHRVLRIDSDIVTLKGDGNPYLEERVERSEIIAVVESVLRGNKVIDCRSKSWRAKERMWLATPTIVRKYILALMRRWMNFRYKTK
jgi:hypothetical protein